MTQWTCKKKIKKRDYAAFIAEANRGVDAHVSLHYLKIIKRADFKLIRPNHL